MEPTAGGAPFLSFWDLRPALFFLRYPHLCDRIVVLCFNTCVCRRCHLWLPPRQRFFFFLFPFFPTQGHIVTANWRDSFLTSFPLWSLPRTPFYGRRFSTPFFPKTSPPKPPFLAPSRPLFPKVFRCILFFPFPLEKSLLAVGKRAGIAKSELPNPWLF